MNGSKTELIMFKPRMKKLDFDLKLKLMEKDFTQLNLQNISVLKLMRALPGKSILMILPLNKSR